MSADRLERYHAYSREHGVNRVLYLLVRILFQPFFLVYFRLERHGRDHVPGSDGRGLLVAANHRSFLDPFVIGCLLPWSRPMHYVAKVELFEKRWQGWFLSRLGAFPVRRGQADEEALDTARAILQRGGSVCIFPEGTRIRTGSLGRPKKGGGRLALETGATVVPVAVIGTEHCRRGWRIYPKKVRLRAGRAMSFPQTADPSPSLANEVNDRIWPYIELQWEWLGGLPPLRKAAVIGAGSWGTAVAILLARGGLDVELGCRTRDQVEAIAAAGANEQYLPGVPLPAELQVRRAAELELATKDLVVLAVPSRALPAAVGGVADRVGSRSAVLVLTKGLVPPLGSLPSEYIGERVSARAIASLGGPAHAREAVGAGAALVLGCRDADLRRQLGEVFDAAGLVCERTQDIAGVEVAGAAKNAAALAAAAAQASGYNAAGMAAAEVWRECVEFALAHGADPSTFSGLAGVGDLTATILAPGSRNRRAGELLGQGAGADAIRATLGQASEGLDSVPQIAEAVSSAGIEAPTLASLAALIEGRIQASDWIADLRRIHRERQAA